MGMGDGGWSDGVLEYWSVGLERDRRERIGVGNVQYREAVKGLSPGF